MPNRIPTPGIKTPTVKKSPLAKPGKPASNSQIKKSETMLKNKKSTGDIAKDKASIANKTGVWPNGYTN